MISFKKVSLLILLSNVLLDGFGQTASLVYEKTINSVVTVETDKALGSGFFISNDLIATNYHVIEDANRAVIFLNSTNKSFEVEGYVAIDQVNDLVILKVAYTKGIPLKFAFKSVKQGDDVLAIGSPKGIPATISKGIVSNLNSEAKLIQIDASISHGSSGGPVLNMYGEVIGVAVGTIETGQNLNFVIPVKLLENLLNFKSSYVKKFQTTVVKNETDFKPEFDDNTLIYFSDGNNTSKKEFLRVFNKNNKDKSLTKAIFSDYLNLYINYKLKVIQAQNLGIDKTEKFKKELDGYSEQLKVGFQFDSVAIEMLVKEAYERQKYDVRAKHLLVSVSPNALPEDTLRAYNKAIEIREEIIKGEDFSKAALKFSDDPSVKDNGGDLGYFTVLQMVYQFETAAYETKINEISMPIRTKFGYHLIKVVDKRISVGQFLVKHIMIKCTKDNSSQEQKVAREKINLIYDKLKSGEKFEDLVMAYSDDAGSRNKDGELPWFGIGKMVPEFEMGTIGIKRVGEFSQPIQTSYGWDIIKLIEKKNVSTYGEEKKELREKIRRDSRMNRIMKLTNSEVENLSAYKTLVNEYRDGILLFELTDKKVWSKAIDDDGLLNYFNLNSKKYGSKSLNEVKGKVIKDYQDYLEKEWIQELRKKIPFAVNEKICKEIINTW